MGRLVSCPDCGHKVSKSAVNCPNCGRPFRAQAGERFSVSGCGLISAGLFVAVVGSFLFLFVDSLPRGDNAPQRERSAPASKLDLGGEIENRFGRRLRPGSRVRPLIKQNPLQLSQVFGSSC
jgi:hypothetical protein